jgi:phytoene dehydrogenase-like protein
VPRGVRLGDGREIRSRVVVTDINAKAVYGQLIPRAKLPRWARLALRSLPLSQSSTMLMLGLEGDEGFGAHHTLFSGGLEALNRIWFDDYERGRPSRGGYLLASMPSATDDSLAPPGHHTVHLGGGIPVCIGSGMIAADMVSEDWSASPAIRPTSAAPAL